MTASCRTEKGQHGLVRLPAAMISTGFLGERSATRRSPGGPTLASPLLAEEGPPARDLSMSMALSSGRAGLERRGRPASPQRVPDGQMVFRAAPGSSDDDAAVHGGV